MPTAAMLLSIPFTVALLACILALSAIAERRFLSARSLVLSVVRTNRNSPEFAEAFVAQHLKQLADQRRR